MKSKEEQTCVLEWAATLVGPDENHDGFFGNGFIELVGSVEELLAGNDEVSTSAVFGLCAWKRTKSVEVVEDFGFQDFGRNRHVL